MALCVDANRRLIRRQVRHTDDVSRVDTEVRTLLMDERAFALGPTVVAAAGDEIHFLDVVAADVAHQDMHVPTVVLIERKIVRIAETVGVNLLEHIRFAAGSKGV